MIEQKTAARLGSTASMHARMFSTMNAATSNPGHVGTSRSLKRPVATATTITTAKITSEGAGSTRTTANRRKPSTTAAS